MLLKITGLLALLGIAACLAEGPSTRGLCPKFCKCTYSGNSQGVARCSTLDPPLQHQFPQDIRHLVVQNDPNPKNITENLFLNLGLNKLSTIKIVNSSILSLDVKAFNGLSHLMNVDLSDNRLMLIHPDTFINNTELRRLILSGNPLQLTQMLPTIGKYVLRSDSLSELYLSRCQMNQLSEHAFSELSNLDVLDLSYNSLRHIDPQVFFGLDQLEELDLSYNEFTTIPSDTFSNIEDLTTLNLRGNPLQTFDLPNLPELKELDMSQCDFTYLGPVTFEGVLSVSNLNMSHNSIEKIDPDAFDAMTNLRYLDLSNNELKGPLDTYLFEPVANLESLSLASNQELEELGEFVGEFSSLYYYDISDCGLSTLSNKMFKGMHYLATLNASNNEIEKIDPTTFTGLTHINVIDLSNNLIHTFHSNIFAANHEISKLYLSGNQIHHLSVPFLRTLPKLYLLDLSYNSLTALFNHTETQIMQTKGILKQLTHLNVAGNFIKNLHIFNFASMINLQVLDVSDNPIECTQNFNRVIKWLSSHRILPNSEQQAHPVSMVLDDTVETFRRWMTIFDVVCPVDLKAFEAITSKPSRIQIEDVEKTLDVEEDNEVFEPQVESVKIKLPEDDSAEDAVEDTDDFIPRVGVKENSRYAVLEMEDDPNTWPTLFLITVFCVFIFVAFMNIGLIIFFRARRNYSLVGYKSTFSGSSGLPHTRFPIRKGQRNAYQKLYEECSIPRTPIVKNNKKLNIISIFGSNSEQAAPQNV